jgi:hypothetical protein
MKIFTFFIFTFFVSAQTVTISGYIEDAKSGEKLIGANIYEPSTNLGTTSNSYGFYSFTLPKGKHTVVFSYIGYKKQIHTLDLITDKKLTVKLEIGDNISETVEVVAEREKISEKIQMSVVDIPINQIQNLPALGGEVDVLKTVQLLPGVQSGSEGTSGIYVRGGGPDQNLIMIDDAPVYNASHLFGFFSIFNSDAIKKVNLTKGGFPARFGGRLSSVLEMHLKDGNMQEFSGKASIGLIASKIFLEGPINKGKTSFVISGRRTYIDILARPFMDMESGIFGYYFYDFNTKINHIFGENDRVFLSLYTGDDRLYTEEKNKRGSNKFWFGWGNLTSTLRWNHIFNNKLFSNTTVIYSKYQLYIDSEIKTKNFQNREKYTSGIEDFGAKIDFEYHLSPENTYRFGLNAINHKYNPGASSYKGSQIDTVIVPVERFSSNEFSAYFENELRFSSLFSANLGIHSSLFTAQKKIYTSFQPRISVKYMLTSETALKASYVQMNQYIHLLTNSMIGLPTDLWLPATENVPPQKSEQISFGFATNFNQNTYEFSIETYYKTMEDLIEYLPGANFLGENKSWENKVVIGTGKAYGLEFFLQKKTGKTSGWIGYTISRSDRTFSEIENGKTFPYRYDRTHDISFVLNHKYNENWELSASWVYGTGNAVTLGIAKFQTKNPLTSSDEFFDRGTLFSKRNGHRMPAYHRLDFSVKYDFISFGKKSSLIFSLYNAYNRTNPLFIYFSTEDEKKVAKQVGLFPLIPAFNYHIEF